MTEQPQNYTEEANNNYALSTILLLKSFFDPRRIYIQTSIMEEIFLIQRKKSFFLMKKVNIEIRKMYFFYFDNFFSMMLV